MAKQTPSPARSEIVSVRLDARHRYLAELGARATHRSVSGFFEWAMMLALDHVPVTKKGATLGEYAGQLWHSQAADRAAALAWVSISLLTTEERAVWDAASEEKSLFAPGQPLTYPNLNAAAFRHFYDIAMSKGLDAAVQWAREE